ncbi:hypothetical protein PM082_019611 [Marasmius tenuissimus]|nr:hypothetical protein PM082_019611 [Marasmius tenuissimus]
MDNLVLVFVLLVLITFVNAYTTRRRRSASEYVAEIVPNRTRMFIYFKRNLDMTAKECSDYWRGPHAKLFLSTKSVRENLLRYEQLHVNQEWKERLLKEGFRVPDFDGVMIAEGPTMDNILTVILPSQSLTQHIPKPHIVQAFNNKEYNEIVPPDTAKYGDLDSMLTGFVNITSVINKLPSESFLPDPKHGVIRKDVQTLVGNFARKPGMNYPDFIKYWTKANTPKLVDVVRATGKDREIMGYELNTFDPVEPTVSNPFPSFTDKWDAVGLLSGRSIGDVMNILKDRQVVEFTGKDAPHFVDMKKDIELIPCDVVSFEIPKL